MPELNVNLIQRVMKRIERDQTMWDQNNWGQMEEDAPPWYQGAETEEVSFPDRDCEEDCCPSWFLAASVSDATLIQIPADACGTTFCFAGHTVLEAGDTVLMDLDRGDAEFCRTPEGEIRTIEERAQELLGLTEDQALVVFGGGAGDEGLDEYKLLFNRETGVNFD